MPRFEKGSDEAKAYMKSIREGRKLKNNYEKMKGHEDLIMTNTAEIAVPKTLLYIDGKGEHKIIKTVTKAGTLTRRDKKPVIKIEPKTTNELKIIDQGKTKKERSTGLLKEIHSNTGNEIRAKQNDIKDEIEELSKSRKMKDKETVKQLINALDEIKEGHSVKTLAPRKRGETGGDQYLNEFKTINFKDDKHYAPRKKTKQ